MKLKNICTSCQLVTLEDGVKIVFSYETPVLSYYGNMYHRHWSGWSATTSRHIYKAIGRTIPKKEWLKMPVETIDF